MKTTMTLKRFAMLVVLGSALAVPALAQSGPGAGGGGMGGGPCMQGGGAGGGMRFNQKNTPGWQLMTPEERTAIAQQLRELQGKEQPARFKVASGGQQIDATGVPYRTPDRIFNEQTGAWSDGAGAAPAQQAMPKPASKAEFDALPKGARFTDPNGQVRIK